MPMTLLSSLNRSECVGRLLPWKEAMEEKRLRVNAGKTKIMICGMGLDLLQSSGKFPCAVCHTGVQALGLKHLTKDTDYRCTRYQGTAHPLTTEGRPSRTWQAGGGSFVFAT